MSQGRNLRDERQVVVRVPPVESHRGRGYRDNKSVKANVTLTDPHVRQELLHRLDPIRNVLRLRLFPHSVADITTRRLLPRFRNENPFREGEALSAVNAREKPSAPAPWAVHLRWESDQCLL